MKIVSSAPLPSEHHQRFKPLTHETTDLSGEQRHATQLLLLWLAGVATPKTGKPGSNQLFLNETKTIRGTVKTSCDDEEKTIFNCPSFNPLLSDCERKETMTSASEDGHSKVTPELSDLRCTESLDSDLEASLPNQPFRVNLADLPPVKAVRDPTLLRDDRVLQNLLRLEDKSLPAAPDYFKFVQQDIVPSMRKIVADWMLEVAQELECESEVFGLAINYLDRFLALCRVTKSKLQLVGAVCLLLSSKFKETAPITVENLIYYSDFSLSSEEIKDFELLILQELRWELSAVTPLDYLDLVMHRLPTLPPEVELRDLKRRTETILVLALTEYKFTYLNPSLLAASALFATLSTCLLHLSCQKKDDLRQLLSSLQTVTHSPAEHIELCATELIQTSPKYLLTFGSTEADSNSSPEPVISTTTAEVGDFQTHPDDALSKAPEVQKNDSLTILVS